MLVAAVAAGSFVAYDAYADRHVTLVFANGSQPVPPLELTFYPEQLAFHSPSPPPAIGEHRMENQSDVVIGDNLVPGHGIVRYRGEGVGAGFAYVRLGEKHPTIQLRPPQTLTGRVGEPIGFWCMGWRCAGIRPVANAEVIVMGGGEHGIDLATARTDENGRFTVTGFDGELDALGLRVRAPGYAIVHESLIGSQEHEGGRAIIAVTPAPIRRGKLELNVDLDPTSLRLLARGLPGIDAVPEADGTFVFDHMPADLEARIIVHGLPETCSQSRTRTSIDGVALVVVGPGAIVSGRVLDHQRQPVAGALVWIGEETAINADSHGNYRITRALPGNCTMMAQTQVGKGRKARTLLGARTVRLDPNGRHVDIDITLDR
jgi:hypothetical protein